MESAFLKWNWVLARSSLSQCYDFHTSYQEKPICYLRMVLFKYGTLVGNGYATNDMFKLSIIYQYVLVVLILLILYLWHARLRLLNFKFLKFISKHDIIYISLMIWFELNGVLTRNDEYF